MMKIDAVIQARVGSSRLRGKVLLDVLGKTMLEYLVDRVKNAKTIDKIVVATSTNEENIDIEKLMKKMGVSVYRGSEDDVLDRYYQTARLHNLQHIVRITADCPILDPVVIDYGVKQYFESKADFCSNSIVKTYPDGQDIEIFSFNTLENAWKNAKLLSEREHVTPYMKKNPEKFKLYNFTYKEDYHEKRWTLDRIEDFKLIKIIIEALYPKNPDFSMEDVLDFLKLNPHLEDINRHVLPGEGYIKSLKEDKVVKTHKAGE